MNLEANNTFKKPVVAKKLEQVLRRIIQNATETTIQKDVIKIIQLMNTIKDPNMLIKIIDIFFNILANGEKKTNIIFVKLYAIIFKYIMQYISGYHIKENGNSTINIKIDANCNNYDNYNNYIMEEIKKIAEDKKITEDEMLKQISEINIINSRRLLLNKCANILLEPTNPDEEKTKIKLINIITFLSELYVIGCVSYKEIYEYIIKMQLQILDSQSVLIETYDKNLALELICNLILEYIKNEINLGEKNKQNIMDLINILENEVTKFTFSGMAMAKYKELIIFKDNLLKKQNDKKINLMIETDLFAINIIKEIDMVDKSFFEKKLTDEDLKNIYGIYEVSPEISSIN